MPNDLVPGRPATPHEAGCPLCLPNEIFRGEIIVEGRYGYVGLPAPDLALVAPYEHLDNHFGGDPFAAEFMPLAFQGLEVVCSRYGWIDYNLVLNFGYVAGQRMYKDPDGKLRHPHGKLLQRLPGQKASNWGLDALVKMTNNCTNPTHSM